MTHRRRFIKRTTRALPFALLAALALTSPASAAGARARAAVAACPSAAAEPSAQALDQVGQTILCLLNVERTRRGLPRLRDNARLAKAAANHSRDMVRRGFFDHQSPAGSTMGSRIKAAGYLDGARGYAIAENIAWGAGDLGNPLNIVDAWMHSAGHRANILNGRLREVGVGVALGAPGPRAGDGGATYTTDFGTRS